MKSAVGRPSRASIKKRGIPWLLIVGEVLLCLSTLRYIVSFVVEITFGWETGSGMAMSVLGMLFNISMALLTVDSVMGIASARPRSWRKVMRVSLVMVASSLLYRVANMMGAGINYVMFNDEIMFPMVAATVVIMLLPSVREFYTAPLAEVPPLRRWLAYIFVWPLVPNGTYRFSDGKPEEGECTDGRSL